MTTYRDASQPARSRASAAGGSPSRMGPITKSQMNTSLPLELHERLRELAWENRRSLSSVVCELLETGLEVWDREAAKAAKEAGATQG